MASNYRPMADYEIVTVDNVFSWIASSLVTWERWICQLELPLFPGCVLRSESHFRDGFSSQAHWRGWDDAVLFPFRNRIDIPRSELVGKLWRRPLSPTQLNRRVVGKLNYASESEAMVAFFKAPVGCWGGFSSDDVG